MYYILVYELKGEGNRSSKLDKYYLMVSDQYNTVDISSLTHGFYLERGWNKDVILSLKIFHEESKFRDNQEPCTPDRTKSLSRCISLCFHRTLIRKTGCRYVTYPLRNDRRSIR